MCSNFLFICLNSYLKCIHVFHFSGKLALISSAKLFICLHTVQVSKTQKYLGETLVSCSSASDPAMDRSQGPGHGTSTLQLLPFTSRLCRYQILLLYDKGMWVHRVCPLWSSGLLSANPNPQSLGNTNSPLCSTLV